MYPMLFPTPQEDPTVGGAGCKSMICNCSFRACMLSEGWIAFRGELRKITEFTKI